MSNGPHPAVPSQQLPKMKVGVNYPWIANLYGNHIGPNRWKNPPESQVDPMWVELGNTLAKNLQLLASLGVKIVRMFILCNGDNYRNNLTHAGIPPGKWDLPPSIHQLHLNHFEKLLETFSNKGLQLIPSLIDFQFPVWEKGREVIFIDEKKQDKFFNTVLDPLLNVSKSFSKQIYAWEVINEPSWLTRRISTPIRHYSVSGFMSNEKMKKFLEKALQKIKDAGFESTVGHRFLEDFQTFPTGTKRQFHYYPRKIYDIPIPPAFTYTIETPDPFPIPAFSDSNAFVGEFAALPFNHGDLWPELDGKDLYPINTVFERLKLLAQKGYELALVWPDLGDNLNDSIKLSPQTQNCIKRFTGVP